MHARRHEDRRQMPVAGADPVGVRDLHHLAVAAVHAGRDDRAGRRRMDQRFPCPRRSRGRHEKPAASGTDRRDSRSGWKGRAPLPGLSPAAPTASRRSVSMSSSVFFTKRGALDEVKPFGGNEGAALRRLVSASAGPSDLARRSLSEPSVSRSSSPPAACGQGVERCRLPGFGLVERRADARQDRADAAPEARFAAARGRLQEHVRDDVVGRSVAPA